MVGVFVDTTYMLMSYAEATYDEVQGTHWSVQPTLTIEITGHALFYAQVEQVREGINSIPDGRVGNRKPKRVRLTLGPTLLGYQPDTAKIKEPPCLSPL